MVVGLSCVTCGAAVPAAPGHPLTCVRCGPERGTLDYVYDVETLRTRWRRPRRVAGMATWLPLLPLRSRSSLPPRAVGPSPLVEAVRLARHVGIKRLHLKLDSFLPSLSLKDRASAVAVAQAKEWGKDTLVAASTGNAASSLATLASCAGLHAVLLVPHDAPAPKLAQIAMHGALLVRVQASYDVAFDLSIRLAQSRGLYLRSTAVNPALAEGKKTVALELTAQMGWHPAQAWFVGVGDGCILGSLWKGLRELRALGWVETTPALVGVQAEGAAPLASAWRNGTALVPWPSVRTFADSIAVGHPRDWAKALRATRESRGGIVAVPDELIRDAMRLLARLEGVLAEPAGAASVAGILARRETRDVGQADEVVAIITGHGLKDVVSLERTFAVPPAVEPTLDAVLAALGPQSTGKTGAPHERRHP